MQKYNIFSIFMQKYNIFVITVVSLFLAFFNIHELSIQGSSNWQYMCTRVFLTHLFIVVNRTNIRALLTYLFIAVNRTNILSRHFSTTQTDIFSYHSSKYIILSLIMHTCHNLVMKSTDGGNIVFSEYHFW